MMYVKVNATIFVNVIAPRERLALMATKQLYTINLTLVDFFMEVKMTS